MQHSPGLRAGKKPIGARLFCLALLVAPVAWAEPLLTPEAAVRLALERPEVEAALAAELDLARSELVAARTWPNPQLSLEHVSAGQPRNEPDETSLLLSQQFELGGRRQLQRRAAELGVSAAAAGVVAERQRLRLEVLRRYYALVAIERQAAAQRTRIEALDELARVAASRSEAGDLSGYESRRIQQSGALAQTYLEETQALQLAARQRLAGLIGIEGGRVAIPEWVDLLPTASRLDGDLAWNAPPVDGIVSAELAALDARRSAAAAAAQAARRPSVPVTLGIGQRRIDGPDNTDNALLLEVSLPLPLFDRNEADRARAKAESQRAESHYRMRLGEVRASLEAARTEVLQLTAAALRLRAEVVPQAQALTHIARASFAEGELDLPGLLAAFDAEVEVVNRSLDLQHRARTAWIELERLTQHQSPTPGDLP